MSEQWRKVPGYEGTYEVSSLGRVKSLPRNTTRGGLLSIHVAKRGYPAVGLVQNGQAKTFEVHRLVALAFIGPRQPGMEVRHLDGDPLNPALTNLAYGTRSENVLDKRAHGTDHNVNKTHCPNGHEYTTENTWASESRPGSRYCRACAAIHARQWSARKNAETKARATRSRAPWTDDESRIVLDPTLSTEEAAALIGRSMMAVMSQRVRLRKASDYRAEWAL